jgi:hypothetical protein
MEEPMRIVLKLVEFLAYIIVTIVILFIAMVTYFWWSETSPSLARRLAADSLLVNNEQRIAGVTTELLRRSPGYFYALRDMEKCMVDLMSKCDVKSFITRRDEAMQRDWGEVVTRLSVVGDWGEYYESADSHERWRKLVAAVGGADIIRYCDPVVEWQYTGTTDQPFRGVRCKGDKFFPY